MESSIFELIDKAKKFAKIELINAIIGVSVFGIIFIIFLPWGGKYYDESQSPFWLIGPPLIYFIMDLLAAVLLALSLKNELHPKKCYLWIILQIVNLVMLTVLGFYMVYYYYSGFIYVKLSLSLIILYGYKSFRVWNMCGLIREMKVRCQQTSVEAHQRQVTTNNIEKY